jgi:Na+/H+ antiporter NhaD/arsenite permease-like protein
MDHQKHAVGVVSLGIANLVPVDQLFSGFAGDAVIAIMATMILGAGLDRTGVLSHAASFMLRWANGEERRLLLILCGLTGLLSAFMQNPALTALFLPVAARISSRTGIPLSRLLMPMACCIILGGTLTMVGNSPTILLNDLIGSVNRNLPSGADTLPTFSMFAVAPIGLVLLTAGLIYFTVFWDKLLPARETLGMDLTEAFQLMPEQSTAAIVIHHPEAKYYAVRGEEGRPNPSAPETVDESVALDRAAAGGVTLAEARADT